MNARVRDQLKDELRQRGFRDGLVSPHEGFVFSDETFADVEIYDFLDAMVVRREKAFWSVAAVGRESATQTYDDLVLIIDAIKAVLRRELANAERAQVMPTPGV